MNFIARAVLIFLFSCSCFGQSMPACPPESEKIDSKFVSTSIDKLVTDYKNIMKARQLELQSMQLELKTLGKWNSSIQQAWENETVNDPVFKESLVRMKAAQAAEDPTLIAFIKSMNGPRDVACRAMATLFQSKIDFFSENYKQFAIAEANMRKRLELARSETSPR